MDAFSTYLISSGLIAFLLVGAECLICSRNTHHRLRRVYYIAAILLSLGLPLVAPLLPDVRFQREVQLPSISIEPLEMEILEIESPTGESNWQQYIEPTAHGVWVAGAATVFLYLCLSLIRLRRVVAKAEGAYGCKRILFLSSMTTPFSFAGRMYLPTELRQTESLVHVFRHERCHIKDGHQWDLLLLWAFLLLHWWNPAAWLLGRKLKANLEYLADQSAILKQESAKTYQYELVRLASSATAPLCNTFNNKHLKQRIIMMNRVDSSIRSKWNYLVALPIAAVGLIGTTFLPAKASDSMPLGQKITTIEVSSIEDVSMDGQAGKPTNPETNTSPKEETQIDHTTKELLSILTEASSNAVVEMSNVTDALKEFRTIEATHEDKRKKEEAFPPRFPNGQSALIDFLSHNVTYPQEAALNNIEGRVLVRINLDAKGNILKAMVAQSVHPLLDAEALRVVGLMPQWEPAIEGGQAKPSSVTLPILFKLSIPESNAVADKTDNKGEAYPSQGQSEAIYQLVDEMPEFPGGGIKALLEYVRKNLQLPLEVYETTKGGRAVVRFVVEKDGSISRPEIIKSATPEINKEALRLVRRMPRWKPGKQNGKPVAVQLSLPILIQPRMDYTIPEDILQRENIRTETDTRSSRYPTRISNTE
ncbi:MAG: TonB family protein [Porphyromonas sp.]|nr:TonB family protein [Porphyromonas sp.]